MVGHGPPPTLAWPGHSSTVSRLLEFCRHKPVCTHARAAWPGCSFWRTSDHGNDIRQSSTHWSTYKADATTAVHLCYAAKFGIFRFTVKMEAAAAKDEMKRTGQISVRYVAVCSKWSIFSGGRRSILSEKCCRWWSHPTFPNCIYKSRRVKSVSRQASNYCALKKK